MMLHHGMSHASSLPIVTRSSRLKLSPELQAEAQSTNFSIVRPAADQLPVLYKSYPNGSVLFPNNSDVAANFNAVIQAIKANPELIEFFRKMHLESLNQLYNYIMKIYTNLNLINPGYLQSQDSATATLSDYLNDDAVYATNKKKLLMNHFLNLIHAQFSASVISYLPKITPDVAASFGKMFIENDKGIDLNAFAQPQTNPKIIQSQMMYVNFLQKYILFFQSYTKLLGQVDIATGFNQYCTIAQFIFNYLNSTPADDANPYPALTKTNPMMFFYDVETMRALRFIPAVAATIPKDSKLIPWAPAVVDAAVKQTKINGNPAAYFKDSNGNITTNQSGARLYLISETGSVLFEEELLAQPAWLNSQNEIIKVVRGCMGDFSAIVGMGIIDTTLETIIQKAVGKIA